MRFYYPALPAVDQLVLLVLALLALAALALPLLRPAPVEQQQGVPVCMPANERSVLQLLRCGSRPQADPLG